MKRWGLLAAAALLSIGTALAAEEPSRHIRTTISGEAYAVAVDAGVYGEEQKAVQAYRVTTLDLGKNPEAHFDLALWFGADALLEKTGGDYTIFYPKGEDAEVGARDEAGFSPYGLYFERAILLFLPRFESYSESSFLLLLLVFRPIFLVDIIRRTSSCIHNCIA